MNFEQKYYEQVTVWNNYTENKEEKERVRKTLELIPDTVESVLDIGCGIGILTNNLKQKFVVGIDFARTPLKYVSRNPVQASITDIPLQSKKFDMIIITEVLEHLDDNNFSRGINEIIRLDPKYIIISTPFEEDISLGYCKCSNCGNLFNPAFHQRSFNSKLFSSMFIRYLLRQSILITPRIVPNTSLIKFKQKIGIFAYSKKAICNKCGSPAIKPPMLIYLSFGFLNQSLIFIKNLIRMRRPYHQILLFEKKEISDNQIS